MHKPVYIRAARAICAQDTFIANELPEQLVDAAANTMHYQHPDYNRFFSIMQLRRMSRITRTGMVAAIECLAEAGIKKPEAILTGTGKGSISDTEKFIQHIRDFKEGTLNPTPFIQSTYNALNGLISLHHDTSCYNTTFVHRGHSLELALTDAYMLFQECRINNALVGSFEEITQEHFIIQQKLGYWKKEITSTRDLLGSKTPGTIAGEGTFFFLLQQDPANTLARLTGLRMLVEASTGQVITCLHKLLQQHHLDLEDIDLVFLGYNGDCRYTPVYDAVAAIFSQDVQLQAFKPACGEFDTSGGFALWLAAVATKQQKVHPALTIRKGTRKTYKNVVIYNNFKGVQHSIYLLQHVSVNENSTDRVGR